MSADASRMVSATGSRRSRSTFYILLAIGFLLVALAGFSTTYFFPLSKGTFAAPPVVHLHGVMLFSWVLLFIAQAGFVRSRNMTWHRRAGWVGALLAAGIVISGIAVGSFATHRDLATGGETWPYGAFVNIVIEMLLFGSLVAAAIATRKRPEHHKRFLVLAMITVLGPAWFRFRHFMPFVPNPVVSFSLVADSVLLIVIARDWRLLGRVHPVYLWAGAAMFAVHLIELTFDDSETWLRLGKWLLPGA